MEVCTYYNLTSTTTQNMEPAWRFLHHIVLEEPAWRLLLINVDSQNQLGGSALLIVLEGPAWRLLLINEDSQNQLGGSAHLIVLEGPAWRLLLIIGWW